MKKGILVLAVLLVLGAILFLFRESIIPSTGSRALEIVLNTEETDISPYGLDLNNITRIQNIYEGLVAFDRNLRLVPALAVSWGYAGENEWEFRLRKGVKFHDGSLFGPQDVLDAYDKAKKSGNIQIAGYVSTIKEIRQTEDGRIVIATLAPDPLLLSKLTKLFIFHEGNIGTGAYQLDEYVPKVSYSLKAFPEYWGGKPSFERAEYRVVSNRTQRETDFEEGEIDLLVGLTEAQAMKLPSEQVITNYGLEVNFLMFQLDHPIFKDRAIRQAVQTLIDPAQIEDIGNHFVRSVNQFIAPGVFGYNQNIPTYSYSSDKEARNLFGGRLEKVDFYYLDTYRTLTEYVSHQMEKAGFSVNGHAVGPDELIEKIQSNQAPMFLIGWRAEDGDAGGFFDAFVYSKGPFNNGRYTNLNVDRLIRESQTEMNPQERLTLLQKVSEKVNEDVIGVPLFETSRLFGLKKNIKWKPRLDGLVLAAEVRR